MLDTDEAAALLAIPRSTVRAVSGLSVRQIDYWASTGLVLPSTDRMVGSKRIRLYSFADTMSLLVAAELRQRGVSLQTVRQVVEHLQGRGYPRPLTQLRYATIGKRVYFQYEDGAWSGDIDPDQLVLHETINLQPLRGRVEAGIRRQRSDVGRAEKRRGVVGNRPVFAGTRIPVETVRRYLDAGRSDQEILDAFPDLTGEDLAAVREDTVA